MAAWFAWIFATRLSADALGMVVGFIFGVLSALPVALVVLAATRPRRIDEDDDPDQLPAQAWQPPVVMPQPQPWQRVPPVLFLVADPNDAPGDTDPNDSPVSSVYGQIGEW